MNAPVSLTISLDSKKAKIRERIAVNEVVDVYLEDVTGYTPSNLRLSIIKDNIECGYCNTFIDNQDGRFKGQLDTNTQELLAYFKNAKGRDCIEFSLTIYDTVSKSLLVNTFIHILNNPYKSGLVSPPSPSVGVISPNDYLVYQQNHGFAVGKPVYLTSVGFYLAQANSLTSCKSVGIVKQIIDQNHFIVAYCGIISGLSSLGYTQGTLLYLSDIAAGSYLTVPPMEAGSYIKGVLQFINSDKAVILNFEPILISPTFLTFRSAQSSPGNATNQIRIYHDITDDDFKIIVPNGTIYRIVTDKIEV